MAKMEDLYIISFLPRKFIVHLPHVDAVFNRDERGFSILNHPLYKSKFSTFQKQNTTDFTMDNVEENKCLFTDCQVERAKNARQIYRALGIQSVNDFIGILTMNEIQNLPITIDYINLAKQICLQDIRAIKAKTKRSKPAPVISDNMEIPSDQNQLL